ncbi:SURF1 family protein [Nocardioides sp. W3-2-3]|uniref:SURF1 family protein n=1 Tax=Nocardioides convexus TaxID=2712224 RepID=UPI002418702E|nr:SURF1 family protein [Nocardioides convexus]NHA00968.1 SURF1 family protein [Nocardioides convexus]
MVRWWSVRLWGVHLLALVGVSFAAGMGVWQYDAWQDRRAAEQVDLTHADPVPITDVLGPDDPFPTAGLGRPVEVTGTFLTAGTVLVTGREGADGADGSWLVTPLSVGAADRPAVPVVRGWVPAGTRIADVPPPPTGEVDLLGWLQPTESAEAGDDDPSDGTIAHLRVADLVQTRRRPGPVRRLRGGRADRAQRRGGRRGRREPGPGFPPASRFTGLRNILYAIEWWVFAAFAVFLWWRHVRDVTTERPAEEAADETEPDDAVPSKP